jgi:class 3 adenylate cyclase
MSESRKIAAILVADVVGYSRLAGADEEGTLARLRALRGDLIDPAIAAHRGRTSISRAGAFYSAISGDPTYLGRLKSIVDGMRKAGVPE